MVNEAVIVEPQATCLNCRCRRVCAWFANTLDMATNFFDYSGKGLGSGAIKRLIDEKETFISEISAVMGKHCPTLMI